MRAFVVAGPRACGKSTFIERCRARARSFLPSELAGIATAHGPIYFMDLGGSSFSGSTDVLIHVDLVTPFAELRLPSPQELQGKLEAKAFADYPGASLFRDCADLQVLTLRAPRARTLRRWLDRCAARGTPAVPTVMAQLYSDASGEAAYSALYEAWDRHIAQLPNSQAWDVLESEDELGYSIVRR